MTPEMCGRGGAVDALPLLWASALFGETRGRKLKQSSMGAGETSQGLVAFVNFHPAVGETEEQILSLLNDRGGEQGFF